MKKLLAGSIALFCVASLFLWFAREPRIVVGPSLPPGKVEPQLVASYGAAFLLAPGGSLWAWRQGQSQYYFTWMTNPPSETPLALNYGSDWQKIAGTSFGFALAIKTNGTLWGFGRNSNGELAQASGKLFSSPVQIGSDNDWRDICVGAGHSLALKKDGSIWAWGLNMYGQIGDGTTNNCFSPFMVGTNRDWKSVVAGGFESYAMNSNGTVWGWGLDVIKGSPPNSKNVLSPVQIDPATNWSRIWASDYVLFGLKTDGTLWIFGQNAGWAAYGFVNHPATNFVQLGNDSDWEDCVSGQDAFFARKKNGSWWACGHNGSSEMGFGPTHDFEVKWQRVPFSMDPWAFSRGGHTTLLLAKDGTLWTWGMRIGAPPPSQPLIKFANRIFSKLHVRRRFDEQNQLVDHTPHLLWQLPPEVRKSLETNSAGQKENRQ